MKLKTLLKLFDCQWIEIVIHQGKTKELRYINSKYYELVDDILKDFTGNERVLGFKIHQYYEECEFHIYLSLEEK